MLDISLAELFLIVVVAVIFIGPKELPHVIRGLAKAMRAIKSVTGEIKKTWDEIADSPDIKMIRGDDGKWYESFPTEIVMPAEAGIQRNKKMDPRVKPEDDSI